MSVQPARVKSTLLLIIICWTMHAQAQEPVYRIVTKHPQDTLGAESTVDSTVFSVQSSRGIGSAVIHRPMGGWTNRALILKLQLKGLEELRVTADPVTWIANVSSSDQKSRLTLKTNHQEHEIRDPKDRYWSEIQMRQPGKRDFFEVKLPKAILADNPESITLSWIDFYRS